MAVSLTPKFNAYDIKQMLKERLIKLEQEIQLRFRRVGEEFVKQARQKGDYNDQTGNLRNSIGYVILRNGEQIFSNFRKSARIKSLSKAGKERMLKGSDEGVEVGKKIADDIAANYPAGYTLIVVAGMDYAAAVESKGKDVITGSSRDAEINLKQAIQSVAKRMSS